jgi:isopenicillin N synthase-like dioxygenase
LFDPPQEFKQSFEDTLFLVKVRYYNSVFTFTSMSGSLVENARIDEQLANSGANVREGTCHRAGKLLPAGSRTPSSGQLYVFDTDIEAQ